MKIKVILITLLSLVFQNSFGKTSWKTISKTLEHASKKERSSVHKEVLKILSSVDADHEGQKRKTSFLSFFFSEAIAGDSDRCFYGGWVSIEVNGECQEPWRLQNNQAFQSEFADQTYTPDYFCSRRSDVVDSNNMVRCNPYFFGADEEGGKCVASAPSTSLSERCHQASAGLIDNHIENFLEDPAGRSRYSTLVSELINYCSEKRTYSCHSMAKQLEWQLEQMNASEEVGLCAPGFIDSFLDLPEFQDILRLINDPPEEVPDIWAPPLVANYSEACNIEGMSDQAKSNCESLLNGNDLPTNALLFALEGMRRNATSFETDRCFDGRPEFEQRFSDGNGYRHHSLAGLDGSSDFRSRLENGIPNKCTMIINDVGERLSTHGGAYRCQMRTYHIDLCGASPMVRETTAWVGYGTCKNGSGNENREGVGTTLLGFHVTNVQSFNFGKDDASYNAIRRNYSRSRENRIPSLALFGLQNSNNGSMTDYKYLHIGAYTSAGCPSLAATDENYDLIDSLAENGPSVVVNYQEGEMEPFQKCEEQ